MRKVANDCGFRNSFGYYDARVGEIVLKRPCFVRSDIEEVLSWIHDATNLRKFSVGIGNVENVVIDDTFDNLYGTARGVIRQGVIQSSQIDNEVLLNMLARLRERKNLRNLGLRCYMFSEDAHAFAELILTINTIKSLVYLDLSGCYFSDEQLLTLAKAIAESHISHLIWPEPRMSTMVMEKVGAILAQNKGLVIMRGVPLDFQKITEQNREELFTLGEHPTMINEKEVALIKEYADSIRLGIAFEKQRLLDLERVFEGVLA